MSSEYCIPDLIAKKRDGFELSEEEIHHFVKASYSSNGASESQIGAMLMAMYLKEVWQISIQQEEWGIK